MYRIYDGLQLFWGLLLEITVVVFGLFPQKKPSNTTFPKQKKGFRYPYTVHVWYIYIYIYLPLLDFFW